LNKVALFQITENPRFPVIFTTGRIPTTYSPLPLEATKDREIPATDFKSVPTFGHPFGT